MNGSNERCPSATRLPRIIVGIALLALLSVDANGALRNRYSFNNSAGAAFDGASIVEDLVGGADGIVRGINGQFTGSQLTLPGGSQASFGAYVDLPNGLASSLHGDATFEAWYTINAATSWPRIFDFGDMNVGGVGTEIYQPGPLNGGGAGDSFFYAPMQNMNINQQRVSLENEFATTLGGEVGTPNLSAVTLNTNEPQTLGEQVHVAISVTKDADGPGPGVSPRLTLFLNGVQAGTVVGAANAPHQLEHLNDVNNWLGRSNYAGDQQFNGSLNEFRIYDHAFTASDAAKNYLLGPDRMGELLALHVFLVSGQVKIVNHQDFAVPIDNYRISSSAGWLNPSGWNSFDDQEMNDPPGVGWDEAGGSDANELIEFYLGAAGDSFPAGGLRQLGHAFNPSAFGPGVPRDLVFEYGGPNGLSVKGDIDYIFDDNFGFGDYNQDGFVNAADYTVYRNRKSGIGGTTLPNEGAGVSPGQVTIEDYLYWKAHYTGGPTFADGASNSLGGNVPEPTTLALLAVAILAIGGVPRKGRVRYR